MRPAAFVSTPISPSVAAAASCQGAAAHAPLAGLAGSHLSSRFCYWRGESGRRYLFSVFGLARRGADQCPRFDNAVALTVSHGPDGRRELISVAEWRDGFDDIVEEHRWAGVAAGANEIHLHLLTEHEEGRLAIIRDLRALCRSVGQNPGFRFP
jgi:hypothetical protein